MTESDLALMIYTGLAVLVGTILVLIIKHKSLPLPTLEQEGTDYRVQGVLFTPAERSFYGALSQAVSEEVLVFGKVRVADVITPNMAGASAAWKGEVSKISAKHFHYVICNKDDLSFICGIELDDESQCRKRNKLRGSLLEGVCKSASFPFIRFKAEDGYNVDTIKMALAEYIPAPISKSIAAKADALAINAKVS